MGVLSAAHAICPTLYLIFKCLGFFGGSFVVSCLVGSFGLVGLCLFVF